MICIRTQYLITPVAELGYLPLLNRPSVYMWTESCPCIGARITNSKTIGIAQNSVQRHQWYLFRITLRMRGKVEEGIQPGRHRKDIGVRASFELRSGPAGGKDRSSYTKSSMGKHRKTY